MQVEVTDVDQAAADEIAPRSSWDNFVIAQSFARHREAARIEGIRLGLEAAAGVCEKHHATAEYEAAHDIGPYYDAMEDVESAIRAIDPAVIGAGQLPQRANSGR